MTYPLALLIEDGEAVVLLSHCAAVGDKDGHQPICPAGPTGQGGKYKAQQEGEREEHWRHRFKAPPFLYLFGTINRAGPPMIPSVMMALRCNNQVLPA